MTIETSSGTSVVSSAHAGWCICCVCIYIDVYFSFLRLFLCHVEPVGRAPLYSAVASVLHGVTPGLSCAAPPGSDTQYTPAVCTAFPTLGISSHLTLAILGFLVSEILLKSKHPLSPCLPHS